jgi:hypothetical protein
MSAFHYAPYVLVLLLMLPACVSSNQTQERGFGEVVGDLREEGLNLQPAGPVSQDVLSIPGRAYTVDGVPLELYVYQSVGAATLDVQQLKRRGLPNAGPPTFFQGGNVIALYFGDAVDVERALSEAVGAPLL